MKTWNDIDIVEILKSLEDSGVLIDGVTKAEKHKIKKQDGGYLWVLSAPLADLLVQPLISPVIKNLSGREVRRGWRRSMVQIF